MATVNSNGKVTAKKAGTATITCKTTDGSKKTASCEIKVEKLKETERIDISSSACTYNYQHEWQYTGQEITPEVKVNCEGKCLRLNEDYIISYSDNIQVGTGTITIWGKGLYKGSRQIHFEIIQISKSIAYDSERLLQEIGAQEAKTPYCKAYAMAYYHAIVTGKYKAWTDYWISSGGYAKGSSAINCISQGYLANEGTNNYFKGAIAEIDAGRPCIMYVTQKKSGGQHWVLVVGYKDVTDKENLSLDNFIFFDSINRKEQGHIIAKGSEVFSGLKTGTGNFKNRYILVRKK